MESCTQGVGSLDQNAQERGGSEECFVLTGRLIGTFDFTLWILVPLNTHALSFILFILFFKCHPVIENASKTINPPCIFKL